MLRVIKMEKLKIYLSYSGVLICIFLFGALLNISLGNDSSVMPASAGGERITVIIDPGHGGEDSGAVANGVYEKDINLAIALDLRDMLIASGYDVIMTRDTDISIYDPSASTTREKKLSDMKNRLEMINSSKDNILLSIHQNKFEQSKYSGAQIFYSVNDPSSERLAQSIRASVTGLLQPDNKRELKPEKSVYILKNAEVPAVIVECGFISNEQEAQKLSDKEYQKNMAFAIMCGFLEFQNRRQERAQDQLPAA